MVEIIFSAIDFYFFNPLILAMAYDDLGNLGDKKWLTNNSIDPWLLNLWKTMLA